MMSILKSHQADLLRTICGAGAMPAAQLDGRVLRPLLAHGLIVEAHGIVRPTPAGRALAERSDDEITAVPAPLPSRLSESQEEVLRYLLRQTGPVPEDHVDGRVMRALETRGLVESARGWVRPTDAAEPYLRQHTHKDRQRGHRRAASSPRSARGETILRIVEELERAIPLNAELKIGGHPAYADDLLAALRKLGREMA